MSQIEVEIVFALSDQQDMRTVEVESGATVADVLTKSGLLDAFPEHDITALTPGIWGRAVESGHPVKQGDRVEFYRPLEIDPREARRRLALSGRTMGNSDAD
jgi:putative ubiquitin-RnfH superfamily antitoxin RatB of RatAB toxin-antitoxin module